MLIFFFSTQHIIFLGGGFVSALLKRKGDSGRLHRKEPHKFQWPRVKGVDIQQSQTIFPEVINHVLASWSKIWL